MLLPVGLHPGPWVPCLRPLCISLLADSLSSLARPLPFASDSILFAVDCTSALSSRLSSPCLVSAPDSRLSPCAVRRSACDRGLFSCPLRLCHSPSYGSWPEAPSPSPQGPSSGSASFSCCHPRLFPGVFPSVWEPSFAPVGLSLLGAPPLGTVFPSQSLDVF